jgi:hypothetical protein
MTSPGYPETGTTDGGRILADEVAPPGPRGAAASSVPHLCADCHTRRPVRRGLCRACYGRHKLAGTLDQYPPKRQTRSPVIGLTHRRLDYWARRGFLTPVNGATPGSGYDRQWPESELAVAAMMLRLTHAGLNLEAAHRVARDGDLTLAPGIRLVIDDYDAEVTTDGP